VGAVFSNMSEILLWKSVGEKKHRAAEHHGVSNIVKAVANVGRDGDFDGEVNHHDYEQDSDAEIRCGGACFFVCQEAGAGGEKDCAGQIGPHKVEGNPGGCKFSERDG